MCRSLGVDRDGRGRGRGGDEEVAVVEAPQLVGVAVRGGGGRVEVEVVHARRGCAGARAAGELREVDKVAALDSAEYCSVLVGCAALVDRGG